MTWCFLLMGCVTMLFERCASRDGSVIGGRGRGDKNPLWRKWGNRRNPLSRFWCCDGWCVMTVPGSFHNLKARRARDRFLPCVHSSSQLDGRKAPHCIMWGIPIRLLFGIGLPCQMAVPITLDRVLRGTHVEGIHAAPDCPCVYGAGPEVPNQTSDGGRAGPVPRHGPQDVLQLLRQHRQPHDLDIPRLPVQHAGRSGLRRVEQGHALGCAV